MLPLPPSPRSIPQSAAALQSHSQRVDEVQTGRIGLPLFPVSRPILLDPEIIFLVTYLVVE